MGGCRFLLVVGLTLSWTAAARAEPGAGTSGDPLVVDAFPYAIKGDTSASGPSAIDSYDCASATDESGPEVVFRFTLPADAKVTSWVEGDGGGVDVDVHLLDSLDVSAGVASGCLARGNAIAEADMNAGQRWVVVDSFNGPAQAGAFVLHLEAIGDAWVERVVAEGVSWRARRFADQNGPQVVHELIVDTLTTGVEIRALASNGCQTVGALGSANGAVAGINGGYFATGCAPVSLLKADGNLVGTNSVTRGAFGLSPQQAPLVELVAANQDWPAAQHAHGGGPILVTAGNALSGSAAWAAEGFTAAGFLGANPRTFAGYDVDGKSHLVTVDGRRANAAGMSLDNLAAFAASAEVGLVEATNLDGGGSSTLWIEGATPNGVVNYPSDATQEQDTHPGSRPNSGGLFVFAPPYNHPPRFQTTPITQAEVGIEYRYDVDAIDLDVDDVVSYGLTSSPAGMSIDAASGVITFVPDVSSPATAEVIVSAADDAGASASQPYTLTILGGMGSGGAGGAGAGGSNGEGGGAATADATDGGCSCHIAGRRLADRHAVWLLLGAAVWLARRRR